MSRRGKITKRRETDGESRLESESEAIEKPQTGGNTMEIALAKLVEILVEKSKEAYLEDEDKEKRSMRRMTLEATSQYPRRSMLGRESLVLNKWICDVECFLELSWVKQREWVMVASRYLEREAYNWYLLMVRREPFENWEDFKQRIREYFIPE